MHLMPRPAPELLHTIEDMRTWRDHVRSAQGGVDPRVGFVPTMGALHAGHADLLRRLRTNCDRLVLSIFVNPTQFGPSEDLAKYPRTLDADLEIARCEGVDAVFFPTPEQMYPPGYSTYVEETRLTAPLCGAVRPGHFRGVTTVVLKLFNLVEPHVAYFGFKDAQQFFVLHRMARDLDLRVQVEGVATVREVDGLALSSRNRYLSPAERALAPLLHAALTGLARDIGVLKIAPALLLQNARDRVTEQGFRVQYLEHLALPEWGEPTPESPALLAIAAYLGSTRLIDNVIIRPAALAAHGVRIHDSLRPA